MKNAALINLPRFSKKVKLKVLKLPRWRCGPYLAVVDFMQLVVIVMTVITQMSFEAINYSVRDLLYVIRSFLLLC